MAIRAAWARLRARPTFISSVSTRFQTRVKAIGAKEIGIGRFYAPLRDITYYVMMVIGPFAAVSITFQDWVGEPFQIDGPSMYPFFNAEKDQTTSRDWVWVSKFNARHGLARGMIITFWSPFNPEKQVVKRIIGLEGDIIQPRPPYPISGTIRVPPGHVWVEGDGELSQDSNCYGPIATSLIIGKVPFILSPLKRAGRVRWWEYSKNSARRS